MRGPFVACLITATIVLGLISQTRGNSLPCPSAIKTNVVKFKGELHFVCLQPSTPPRLDVIKYINRELVQSIQVVEEREPDKISSFVDDDGNLRIILAEPNRLNGTSLYSIDKYGQLERSKLTVNSQLVDQLTTWRLDLNHEWQLAIVNQPTYNEPVLHGRPISQRMPPLDEPKPMISVYSWRATYFDRYQLIYLPQDGHVSRLEPMNINGQEYLIVAMDSDRADKDIASGVDSLIFKLDFGNGDLEWRESQRLPTRFALDVKPFYLTHRSSLQQDYYIAVLGMIKVTRDFHTTVRSINVTDEEHGLIIYKYMGDEFVQTHAYAAPDMTKLEAMTYGQGDNYVIMALLSETTRQISLLSFDGLNFQQLPNPSMVPTRRPLPRQRRTMTNLQLFLAPPNLPAGPGDTPDSMAKRTYQGDGSGAPMPMPVLSVSDPELYPHSDYEVVNASTTYKIPTDGFASSEGESTGGDDAAHSKREYIPPIRDDLLGWCKATINSLFLDNFDHLSRQLQVLPRVDQLKPIELDGNLIIEDDLHITNLLYASRIVEEVPIRQHQVIIDHNPTNFSNTFHEIQRVHHEIDQVKNRVDQILVDDGSEQSVFNQFMFDTLVVECHQPGIAFDPRNPYLQAAYRQSCPHVTEIRTTMLNNHNISNIQRQALLTGRSMVIERDVRFEHLVLQGSVNISSTLNDIPISEIVFKKGFVGGPIMGHKEFKNGLHSQSSLNVGGWRGTHVDNSAFFTSSGDQTIPSLRLTQVIVDSNFNHTSHIKRLNGFDLGQHLNQIALTGADNQFDTPIHFDELVLNGPIHMVGGAARLSSIDLEDLWRNTMFKHSSQNISVPMEFRGPVHVSYGGNMIVGGPINGFSLQPREVMMRDLSYVLPNPVIFDGSVAVKDLEVHKALNGIQVIFNAETGRQELSVLYNEGNQQITGDKVLSDIQLGGRSTIMGNINGHLNLSQLHTLANSYGQQHHFQRIRLTGNDVRISDRANIHIGSTINGVHAHELCSLALNTYNRTSNAYQSLRFEQPINFKSLRCASINGFTDLPSTFMTKYGNQYVSGDLRLTNGAIFNTSLTIQSTLNGLNIASLARAISQSVNETRTGHKDYYGDLVLEDLITDRINDLHLSRVFLTRADSPQIVRAPLTFDHLDIENVLNVGNLMTNSFNNLNVTDVMTNTLTYDTPQVIYNHIQLETLQLLSGSQLHTPTINGRNLRRVFSDAVLYDAPQQILAPKTFRGPVEFAERMYMRHRIDGLSFEDIRANLLLLSDDLIDGDLILNNDCTIKKVLEVQSKTINDIDLDAFVNNMIRNGQPLRVAANGSIRFHDVIARDVVVGGTVQGVDLSREAIWRPNLPTQQQQAQPAPAQPKQFKQQQQQQQQPKQPSPLPGLQFIPQLVTVYKNTNHTQLQPQNQQYEVLPAPQRFDSARNMLQLPVPPPGALVAQHNDYNAMLRANALLDLSFRINRHFSLNFYYQAAQTDPSLGPLLHHARDSLFLKATGKPGEPCLHRGQNIALLSRTMDKSPFTQTSRIQETSNPQWMSSVAGYLFVLDDDPSPQVLVYSWDQAKSLYELQEKIALERAALSIKAFISAERACFSVTSLSGLIYCQPKAGTKFLERTNLNIQDVIDMDVHPISSGTSQVLIATISNRDFRQIGDLTVVIFDTQTKQLMMVASKKVIKPLKLHLFRNGLWTPNIQLAVSEAISNNDNALATTRLFSMKLTPPGSQQQHPGDSRFNFHEVQEIRDNQFYDIQSVLLDEARSLLLFQSTHSISVYAPNNGPDHSAGCDAQYSLVQRLPTKGANKFLVFNDSNQNNQQSNTTATTNTATRQANGPMGHFLVLSKDQCDERQQYSTHILKAIFK